MSITWRSIRKLQWLKNSKRQVRPSQSTRGQRRQSATPEMELLEDRTVPTVVDFTGLNSAILFDFDTTAPYDGANAFNGFGFAPNINPSNGQLDSNQFIVRGARSGDLTYGDVGSTIDLDGGPSNGGVIDGGVYGFNVGGGDIIFGVQPADTDYTPGSLEMRVLNNTGSAITAVELSYVAAAFNDQDRSSSLDLSYATSDATRPSDASFIDAATGTDFTTPEAASATPAWAETTIAHTLTGLSLAPGDYLYLRWSTDDVSGTGARDELGIDDITLTPMATITAADLEVTKTVSNATPSTGDTVTYTITVTNNAATTATATGVNLQDVIPDELGAPMTLTPSEGAATVSGGNDVSWTGIDLAPGESATLTYRLNVGAQTGTFNNFVEVIAADQLDPDSTPNNGNGVTPVEDDEAAATVTITELGPLYAIGSGPGGQAQVRVFESATGQERFLLTPFDNYQGGARVAVGDVNGDGNSDIIIGAGPGSSGGHVKVFDGLTGTEIRSFFALNGFAGGVNVGAADINNDGADDIIVGSATAADHVKVFDGRTGALLRSFLAYGGFAGGITVGGGDVNNDQIDDILTGTASNFDHVQVFDGATNATMASFMAFNGFGGGIFVSAGDFNQDGFSDIIVGAGAGAGPHVKVFSGADTTQVSSFFVFDEAFAGGVRVGAADINRDGVVDLLTASGFPEGSGIDPSSSGLAGPDFAAFNGDPFPSEEGLLRFFAFDEIFGGGIHVGGTDN